MTGSAKQSIAPRKGRMDCFVALLLAMTSNPDMHPHSRGARRPRFCKIVPLDKQRAQGMPGAQCTHSLACDRNKAHECSHHRYTGVNPAFPAQWFYGLFRALPGDEFVLSPSLAD